MNSRVILYFCVILWSCSDAIPNEQYLTVIHPFVPDPHANVHSEIIATTDKRHPEALCKKFFNHVNAKWLRGESQDQCTNYVKCQSPKTNEVIILGMKPLDGTICGFYHIIPHYQYRACINGRCQLITPDWEWELGAK